MGLSGTRNLIRIAAAMALLTGVATAQSGSSSSAVPAGNLGVNINESSLSAIMIITNPVRQENRPWNFGVLEQSGFGLTEDPGGFKFLMAGVHAGKVLTGNLGGGMIRGNFEYAVE